jgi:hypothetical protein
LKRKSAGRLAVPVPIRCLKWSHLRYSAYAPIASSYAALIFCVTYSSRWYAPVLGPPRDLTTLNGAVLLAWSAEVVLSLAHFEFALSPALRSPPTMKANISAYVHRLGGLQHLIMLVPYDGRKKAPGAIKWDTSLS